MRIYISGKITDTKDYIERFAAAEATLKKAGFEVINPAKTNATLPLSFSWEEYMAVCMKLIDFCDAVVMLHGWENSQGARLELEKAEQKGLLVYYENWVDKNYLLYGPKSITPLLGVEQ